MTGPHDIDDLDIMAYADGLMDDDPARREEIERRLRASPELAARAESYRSQAAALRRAYGARAHEPVPERLYTALERKPPRFERRVAGIAAMLALIVCAGVTGWLLGRGGYSGSTTARDFVARSYQDYVIRNEETGPARTGQVEPLNWLPQEVSLTLRTPDLTGQGYSLVDKETVGHDGERMVRLTYADKDGRSFTLFLHPRWKERDEEMRFARKGDISLAYWFDGPLASVIASRLSPDETLAISKAVRDALNDPDAARPKLGPDEKAPDRSGGEIAGGVPLPGNGAFTSQEPPAPVSGAEVPGVIPN